MAAITAPTEQHHCFFMKTILLAGVCLLGFAAVTSAAPDLYIRDTPADMGMEPNPDASPMWLSEDIWVRQDPFPGYQPYPFVADPAWLTAVSPLHQNAEYRDPKSSRPNYLYVRVRNRGSTASTGTERLRVYWAKASTGLAWPTHWVDYIAAHCGPNRLYGIEITKPRRNAADPAVTAAELNEYRDAIIAIGTTMSYQFPDGVSYFDKQDAVHEHVSTSGESFAHMSDGFLPWHREFISRYEMLLREAYPKVTLFYWDWRTDPRLYPALTTLLGSFSGGIGAPFNVLAPPSVSRFTGSDSWAPTPTSTLDTTITGQSTYSLTRSQNENNGHNRSHVFIGGTTGNMSDTTTAAEDPIFFMLHANADRLWAMWQRKNTNRLDPALTYSGTSADMTLPMSPWNGLTYNGSAASMSNPSPGMSPWTTTDGYIYNKAANDPSIVYPPIYDTAPLVIPVLQAGESVIIQIPWYPPNPAHFACFGADQGHVCLLARIETSTTAPYGMTTAEGADVNVNTRNNNNIAWKNVTVQDTFTGPLFITDVLIRNIFKREMFTRFLFMVPLEERNINIYNFGAVYVDLGPELYRRWVEGGAVGQGVERLPNNRLQLFGPEAYIGNIKLLPDEVHLVQTTLDLRKDYADPRGKAYHLDLVQYAEEPAGLQLVGGNRFQFNFNKLTLIRQGADWSYLDTGKLEDDRWREVEYDDRSWRRGPAELGYEDDPETTIEAGHITTWFRHRFDVLDPSIYRNLILRIKADDGVVVYLNGTEIYRRRMPTGQPGPDTLAISSVEGVLEDLFSVADVSTFLTLLRPGPNVVAVELHQDSTQPTDASFDLELCANIATPIFPPIVRIPFPPNRLLHLAGEPIQLYAEAADGDGKIRLLSFYADGQLIGEVADDRGSILWQDARPGRHRIEVVAHDDDGLTGSGYATMAVLQNLPPEVRIVSPAPGAVFKTSDSIPIIAEASDVGGRINMVDFYHRRGHKFSSEDVFIGSAFMPPYTLTVKDLPPGHHTFTAYAVDNEGETASSLPISIVVVEDSGAGQLRIQRMDDHLMLYWNNPNAILQETGSLTDQWNAVPNAQSPHTVFATEKSRFYRLFIP
jgi:hypothetical protein